MMRKMIAEILKIKGNDIILTRGDLDILVKSRNEEI
jgi:hypothetical protein